MKYLQCVSHKIENEETLMSLFILQRKNIYDGRHSNENATSGVNNTEATSPPIAESDDYDPHKHRNRPNPTS